MGAIGAPSDIASLVGRTDLNLLVSRYSGSGRTSGRVTTYSCPNPAHADIHPSFTVTTNRNGREVGRCFSQCSWSGDALDLVKWLENLTTGEAASWLRRYLGDPDKVTFYRKPTTPRSPSVSLSPKVSDTAERVSGEVASRFMERYLNSRGWPMEVVEEFSLEVVRDNRGALRVRHNYFAPTSQGEWVVSYWQDRGTESSVPKWLSAVNSRPSLYNLRSLEADSLEGVIICEGAADTITAALCLRGCERVAVIGVPGVSAWRSEWAKLLEGYRVVVASDNDEAGEKLYESVRASVSRPIARLKPKANDLTETALTFGAEELRLLLLSALGTQPEATQKSLQEAKEILLLLEAFPGGSLVEGGKS
jgi:DNA primase